MTIRGTVYQDESWKSIHKWLKKAATQCVGDPQQSGSVIHDLLQEPPELVAAIEQWLECVQNELAAPMCQPGIGDEGYTHLALAIDLILLLKAEPNLLHKPLEKYRSDVLKKNADPDASLCERYFHTAMGRFFSEMRYVADASRLTVATGRVYSKSYLLKLAKVDEINNAIERLIEIRDIDTLAKILDEEPTPFVLSKARRADLRPQLILDADRVLRAAQTYEKDTPNHKQGEPKAPELPTNKFGNVRTPEQVKGLLLDLGEIETASVDEEASLDWLSTLGDVLSDVTLTGAMRDDDCSEAESQKEKTNQLANLVARRCLGRFEAVFQKALMWKYQASMKPFMNDEEWTEWLTDDGKPLTQVALARMAGMSIHLFKQALDNVHEEYLACVKRRLKDNWLEENQ